MKKRNYKLFYDEKSKKIVSITSEINKLKKEVFLENLIPIMCGIGSIGLNALAFCFDKSYNDIKTSFLVCGLLLGGACIGSAFTINANDSAKQRLNKIKKLKLRKNELENKFYNLK